MKKNLIYINKNKDKIKIKNKMKNNNFNLQQILLKMEKEFNWK